MQPCSYSYQNMKKLIFAIYPLLVLAAPSCSKKSSSTMEPFKQIEQPVKTYGFENAVTWADEFDTNGAPDPAKWTYDVGGSGWGNNELEYYTNTINNAVIKDGVLTITAKKESLNGMNYTSSRMVSKNGSDMLYGRVEVKAKLPAGRGTWPAIWMLPNDYAYGAWPNSGEIDIMEHVGYDPNKVHFSVHNQLYNGGNAKTSTLEIPTAFTEYHLYRADWTPTSIKGYYDDQLVFTYTNDGKGSAGWPFDKPFHVLLNLAIGGNWGGVQGVDDSIFPVSMQVDYVHFYKMTTTN
jgi:beta-glucanase (GH16 family)